MSFFKSAYNLLFDQKAFFENRAGLRIPIILTLVYALISTAAGIPLLISTADMIPGGMFGVLVGTAAVSSVISAYMNTLHIR